MGKFTTIWKLGLGAAAVSGVLVKCGVFQPAPSLWLLSYFTILTNLFTGMYFLLEGAFAAFGWRQKAHEWKGALLLCNLLTGCVYYLVLHPGTFSLSDVLTINGLQHFVIPLCVVIDWFMLEPKGRFRRWTPLKWALVPLCYVLFIEIAVPAGLKIGNVRIGYPYFFLDPNRMGVSGVVGYSLGLGVCWLMAGYLLVWIDSWLAKRK